MFKAKLIENTDYYRLRRKQFLISLIPVVPLGLVVNYYRLPFWTLLIAFPVYIALLVLILKIQRAINETSGQRMIEIGEDRIRLVPNGSGAASEIDLDKADRIVLKRHYGMPEESVADMTREIKGEYRKNYIIIDRENTTQQFDFVIESYYMQKQLEKVIDHWTRKGYNVERV